MEAVYKVCGTAGLRATLACAVVGPSASSGEERSYNIQTAKVKRSVKHEVSTAATVGTLHALSLKKYSVNIEQNVVVLRFFPVNSAVAHFSIPAHLSSSQHWQWHTASASSDMQLNFGELHGSPSAVSESPSLPLYEW